MWFKKIKAKVERSELESATAKSRPSRPGKG